MSSAFQRLRGIGIAAAISLAAVAMQALRLPPILDGPDLRIALGKASDPHLLTGWLDRGILQQCALSAPCVQHWNLLTFGLAVFAIAALLSVRPLGLLTVSIAAASPLAVALVADPLGAALSVGVLLVMLAALDVAGVRRYSTAVRCMLAIAIAFADPALVPAALAYGGFGGFAALACSVAASAVRFYLQHPAVDALAGPTTLVAFGFCLFIGGPLVLLAVRHRAFRWLTDDGRPLLRVAVLAFAVLAGGLFSTSGDVAPYWLSAEAAVLIGLVASVPPGADASALERTTIAFCGLLVVQFGLFLGYHKSVTTIAIAAGGDDLRGMLASSNLSACVASDETADHYVLAQGSLLSVYPAHPAPILTHDASSCLTLPDATTVITMTGLTVNDWGNAVPLMQAYRDSSEPVGTLGIEGGKVSPDTPADTPTGRGAFGNQIDSPLGHIGDFTVVSGYTYVPACVPVASGKHLVFAAVSIPGTPALHFQVQARGASGTKTLVQATFPRSVAREPYHWIRYSLPVDESDCTSFAFTVERASSPVASWLTFAGAAIR